MENVQTKKTWKRGPAPKPKSELRTKRVEVYFTDDEYSDLINIAGKMKISNLIHYAITKPESLPKPMPEINAQAWEEIGRIGNNLNQIARHLNSGEQVQIEQIRSELNQLRLKIVDAI